MTNPIDDAYPSTGSGPRSKLAALYEQRLPLAVFTIQEIKDNDFSAHTFLYVLATDRLYKRDPDETGANNDDTIIVDAVGSRFVDYDATALAAKIAAAEADAVPADADQIGGRRDSDGAFVSWTWAAIWSWVLSKLAAASAGTVGIGATPVSGHALAVGGGHARFGGYVSASTSYFFSQNLGNVYAYFWPSYNYAGAAGGGGGGWLDGTVWSSTWQGATGNTDNWDASNPAFKSTAIKQARGYIDFYTESTGSETAPSPVMTIAPSGFIGINQTAPVTFRLEVGGDIGPASDNTYNIGSASFALANGWIHNAWTVLSDGEAKSATRDVSAAEIKAAQRIQPKAWQWVEAVAEKGADHARLHFGYLAQDVVAALVAEGLDLADYKDNPDTAYRGQSRYAFLVEEPLVETRVTKTMISVEREKVTEKEISFEEIKIVDGTPTIVKSTRTEAERHGAWKPVIDAETGDPVMRTQTERKLLRSVKKQVPVLAFVPEMETVEEEREEAETVPVIDPDTGKQKTRLGLRQGELAAFLRAADLARIATLERQLGMGK